MANVDRPNGATLVGHTSGSPLNARIRQYTATTAGNAVFPGDFVKMVAAGTVEVAAAGDVLLGVVVGIVPIYSDLTLKYKPSGTAATLLVCDDPDAEYEIQSDSGTLVAADVGLNADILATAGSTSSGRSRMEIASASKVSTTAQLRIVAPKDSVDNDATLANSKWIVRINEHFYATATGV